MLRRRTLDPYVYVVNIAKSIAFNVIIQYTYLII